MSFASCKSSPSSAESKKAPNWINNVDSAYNPNRYVAAVGHGRDRNTAEKDAFANLARFFGQSVNVDETLTDTYFEVIRNRGLSGWTDTTAFESVIRSSAAMDNLIGAEIKDVWYDTKGMYFAVAAMDKANTVKIYTDLIKTNQILINNLVNMNQMEKNSLEGFSRYQFAAITADANISFENVLRTIGASAPGELKSGSEYWLESANIAKNIPVKVVTEKRGDVDRAENIRNAFSRAISEIGFRTTLDNALYTLEVNLNLTEVNYPDVATKFIQNEIAAKFSRYEISANFSETVSRTGVLPVFSINGEESHATLQEAESRAIFAAEGKINKEYRGWLSEQLAQRLPKR